MNVKNLVLGVGIFILYLLVLNYGFRVFIGQPQWDDYCAVESPRTLPVEKGEQGIEDVETYYEECRKDYDVVRKDYAGWVFSISLIVGILTLILGHFAISVEPVGSSLLASGIGAIVFGTLENWNYLDDVWRFILLVLAFVLLVWVAYKSNSKKGLFGIFGR